MFCLLLALVLQRCVEQGGLTRIAKSFSGGLLFLMNFPQYQGGALVEVFNLKVNFMAAICMAAALA